MELNYVIAITDRDNRDEMAAVFENAGVPMVFTNMVRGTARDEHLSIYGLDATEKALVSGVADSEESAQIMREAKRKFFIDIPGNGIMMTVPIKSVGGSKSLKLITDSELKGGKPQMNFEYELIVAILNEGYSDVLMNAARDAGAGGGTVIHAKGTGRRRAESFFGVSLANEREMVYILAHADEKSKIMAAISEKAGIDTEVGAICFSMPVSSVVGLRARE